MTNRRPAFLLSLLVLVLAISGAAFAQSELVLNSDTTDPLRIPLFSDSTLKIDPETGVVEVTSADTSDIGGTADIAVDAFAPDPNSVEQGKSFTASLGSRGAWQCSRSGDLPDAEWQASDSLRNGTVSVTVDTSIEPGSYTLRFECENAGVTDAATAALDVVSAPEPDADLPAECSDVPLPGNWSRDTTALAGDLTTTTEFWTDVFGNAFPSGTSQNIAINEDRYMVLEFDPGNLPAGAEGQITFDKFSGGISTSDLGNGTPTTTISRCPGDFRPQQDARCRRVDKTAVAWTADSGDSTRCSIDTSVSRYFLNVVYAREREDEDDPATWTYWCPDFDNDDRLHFPECGSLLSTF